jgi:hypothetical protein
MAYRILIVIEQNGKQATFSDINNIEAIEHFADNNQATFRFHTGSGQSASLGNSRLVILDKNPALQKALNPGAAPSAPIITPAKLSDELSSDKPDRPA